MKKIILLLSLLSLLSLSSISYSMCVYNHANRDVVTALYCGSGCVNHWTVKKHGGKKCRTGKGGTLVKDKLRIPVDKHGWVSISENKASYKDGVRIETYSLTFESKNKHGRVKHKKTCTMKAGICDYTR